MPKEKVTNIPSQEEAKRIKSVLEILHPEVTYEIVEQPGGLFTVRPAAAQARAAPVLNDARPVHPSNSENALRPLLLLIGEAESHNNPNAYYSHVNNTNDPALTRMTIDQVIAWQKNYVASGSPSSAAGRFQIIRGTLRGLKSALRLSGAELFDEAMQVSMAIELLRQRGIDDFLSGLIDYSTFGTNLAKEWASLPVMSGPKAGQSYYAGDGLNHALVSVEELRAALLAIR